MKYKKSEYHGYFLAYYVDESDKQLYVLLGKKNYFNRYLHNNPGQYVIPGGKCNFNKDNEITREFSEETGHNPKGNDYKVLEISDIKYREKILAKFYRVTKEEYDLYKDVDFENRDENERELSSSKWFKFSEALELMESGQKGIHEDIWNASKEFLTRQRFRNWYKYHRKTFLTKDEISKLFNNPDAEIYEKYFLEFRKDINAKSYTDWYIFILNKLKNILIPPGFEDYQIGYKL